jgi:hypothetical protein
MKMEQTECSETSAFKLQTPGDYPKESIQHIEHGESLKSRIFPCFTQHTFILIWATKLFTIHSLYFVFGLAAINFVSER